MASEAAKGPVEASRWWSPWTPKNSQFHWKILIKRCAIRLRTRLALNWVTFVLVRTELADRRARACFVAHVRERSSVLRSAGGSGGNKPQIYPWCRRTGCNNSGGPFLVDTQKMSDAHQSSKLKKNLEKSCQNHCKNPEENKINCT